MTCYIYGAGEGILSAPTPADGDMIIAADGGLDHLHTLGITPDLVIGDFDSIATPPNGGEVMRLPVEKDETDMMAAVAVGRARGYTRFVLFGGTGGRPDHTYANYQLLAGLAARGEEGYLVGSQYTTTAISSGSALLFDADSTGTLSVFAVGGDATGVSENGTYYPLTDACLTPTVPLGVSNSFTGVPAEVSVRAGTLLVMWEGQHLPCRITKK